MLSAFGDRQQDLLRALLRVKEGLTVEELTETLSITRTAVNQHLTVLERDGYLTRGELQKTGGRPGRVYLLTALGIDLFPKQYSWFSGLFLTAVKEQTGSEGLVRMLQKIATKLTNGMQGRLQGKTRDGRLTEVVKIMNELEYDAELTSQKKTGIATVEARNCVYHNLAREHPEVCEFDLKLLAEMSGSVVKHEECIVRGGQVCRFQLTPRNTKESA